MNDTLEQLVAPALTAIAGLAVGYVVQQNREILSNVPNGIPTVATFANCGFVGFNGIGHSDGCLDLKYATLGNAAGLIGYGIGIVKDVFS